MPAANSASASLSLAVQMPIAPAAICSFAIAAHLCVLACGRTAILFALHSRCSFAMLRSSLSRSTQSAGVSRSHFEMPAFMGVTGPEFRGGVALDRLGNPHMRSGWPPKLR